MFNVYSEENLLKELDNSTIFMPNNQAIQAFKTGIHVFGRFVIGYKRQTGTNVGLGKTSDQIKRRTGLFIRKNVGLWLSLKERPLI